MASTIAGRVFLLDASEESAARVRALLASMGLELFDWFPKGTGWLNRLAIAKPEILIVDLMLPTRDGLECLKRAKEFNPAIGTVLMHSYAGFNANDIELKALALGAYGLLQRPFSDDRFAAVIRHTTSQMRRDRLAVRQTIKT